MCCSDIPVRRLLTTRLWACCCAALLVVSGCATGDDGTSDPDVAADGGEPDTGEPDVFVPDAPLGYPNTDVVTRIGRDDALDIATWNIENFPSSSSAPQVVADLIASMDLDVVVVEEITDEDAFNEVDDRLPYHHSALSTHTYSDGSSQKLGVFFRADLLELDSFSLLFASAYEFPRPAIRAHFTVKDAAYEPFDFTLLGVHLKAGTTSEDRSRREDANIRLEEFVAGQVSGSADDDVIILGDFNEVLDTASGRNVFAPWLDAPEAYTMHTQRLSDGNEGSFIPGNRLIDHIITTASMTEAVDGYIARIPRLDDEFSGYEANISDHLPVVLPVPLVSVAGD